MTTTFPPLDPLSNRNTWTQTLINLSQEPLAYCPHFPTIARRFEAWWQQELLDRPIFISSTNINPVRPITRRLDLLDDPPAWLAAKLTDMEQTHLAGDALPSIRIDFGPVLLGSLLGGRREVGHDTSWTHAFINGDWSNAPDWTIAEDNADWRRLLALIDVAAEDARGRYLVRTPDLGGSGDVLLNLRGSEALAMDVFDQPEKIVAALNGIYGSWRRAFEALYEGIVGQGTGLINWLGPWSNEPYMIPACDFNALIGPRPFRRLFLPDIARQAATAGRAVFHLDGPDAARHIDALLELPELQAIQFTPGAGTPSALTWVEMFRKIQAQGKSVLIVCPAAEVLALGEALEPAGLALLVESPGDPMELDDLFSTFCRRYGVAAA